MTVTVVKWIVGVMMGYWLVGMIGLMKFDRNIKRTMVNAGWTVVYAFLWLPIYLLDVVDRRSARIEEKEGYTK